MRFKQYYRLMEQPYAQLSNAIMTIGGEVVLVDLRAEDWQVVGNDAKTANVKRQIMMLWASPAFFGKLPDGQYLYYDGSDQFTYIVQSERPSNETAIDLDDLSLGSSWWDYVAGYNAKGVIVKMPKGERAYDALPQPAAVGA